MSSKVPKAHADARLLVIAHWGKQTSLADLHRHRLLLDEYS
jgi:hypothetical protein